MKLKGKLKNFQNVPLNLSRLYLNKKFIYAISSETHALAITSYSENI